MSKKIPLAKTFEESYKIICEKVKEFDENINYFKGKEYLEDHVRNDFINPMFNALGWDVLHDFQKNPYKQEVKTEKSQIQEEKSSKKFADYAFYLSPDFKNPVFFVEAKKPSVVLENNKIYYLQTHKYGWNAQAPISILTDFEEFIIIDCRTKPNIKYSHNTAVKKFHYKDYLNKEKYKEIYYLFSREAIADDSISNFIETKIPKIIGKERQGKLFRGAYKAVDDEFLDYIDTLRLDLARGFVKKNPNITWSELTEATQKTIDRLVFIRFLEDKQIEYKDHIYHLKKWKDFISLSRALNTKYNGVVFKPSIIDSNDFMGIDDSLFMDFCLDISSKESPYNFNVIPIHIIGNIYERFLGKIVAVENGKVAIELKPEVRKAGGVFYTPKYVVDYIVNNTVGTLIKGETPKEIDNMSFADISCGSGSFLIGVYEKLIDYHKEYYHSKLEDKTKLTKNSDDYGNVEFHEGNWIITLKRKQEILLNNVFGVDIDSQAVEVTQLSLFLKLLEDESLGTTTNSQHLLFSKVLPDLSTNIKCGNSLIGWDITENDKYTIEEQKKINPFSYSNSFKQVFSRGGFDAIVGNPPYLKERGNQEIFAPVINSYLGINYHQGKMDYWYYFVHKATELIKDKGFIAYITNSYWMRGEGAKKLREHIKKDLQIISIVDYKNAKVFKDVSGKHNITIIQKKNPKKYDCKAFIIKDINRPNEIDSFKIIDINNKSLFDNSDKISLDSNTIDFEKYDILDKEFLVSQGVVEATDKVSKKQSEEFPNGPVANTGVFVLNKDELDNLNLNENEYEIIKPYVNSTDVIKYGVRNVKQYLIYSDKVACEKIAKNEFPNIKRHLDRFKKYITSSNGPYGIHRPRKNMFFESPKLICKGMFATPEFTFDSNKIYCGFSFSTIIQKNKHYSLKFLLGLMNSKFGEYWFKTFGKKRGVGVDIGVKVFRLFPIPKINFKNVDDKNKVKTLEDVVEKITESVAQQNLAKTTSDKDFYARKIINFENRINDIVYDLYELSADEIEIIENK